MILKGFEDLKSFLAEPKKVVIIGHRNPDGDAVGSTLALKHYLDKKEHQTTVVMPNDSPDFLHWLPGSKKIYKFDKQNKQAQRAINCSDIIFLLDFNALHRVGSDMQNTLEKYSNEFISMLVTIMMSTFP